MSHGFPRIVDLFPPQTETKEAASQVAPPRPNTEPISKHTGTGHKIINKTIEHKTFQMCQTCCMEVYDDEPQESHIIGF